MLNMHFIHLFDNYLLSSKLVVAGGGREIGGGKD